MTNADTELISNFVDESQLEDLFQYVLQTHKQSIAAQRDDIRLEYERLLEYATKEILASHTEALKKQSSTADDNGDGNNNDKENINPPSSLSKKTTTTVDDTTKTTTSTTCAPTNSSTTYTRRSQPPTDGIHITILTGPYQNATFHLRPKPRSPCFVGRSTGKKFRDRGMCIPDDAEVSTTHGKWECKTRGGERRYCFVDVGSTNGSWVWENEERKTNGGDEGSAVEEGVPVWLVEGMVIRVGMTEMRVSFGG